MSNLFHNGTLYKQTSFANEREFEQTVIKLSDEIFGNNIIYFDIKKRIKSSKGDILSIPDGYMISFADARNPRLYIIENEMSTHHAYKHIGLQLWDFASSFKEAQRKVKTFLMQYVKNNLEIRRKTEQFLKSSPFPNISELLDHVIFENDYGFIVIIDEATEDLNFAFRQLAKQPEVIELKKYVSEKDHDDYIYEFLPFQEDVRGSLTKRVSRITDIDTVVCPANEEGFKQVFMAENRWHAIRMSPSIIPQIKYIAMYETAPVSAIRWIGSVNNIKPYKDTGKYELVLTERTKLPRPVKMTKEEYKNGIILRASRYTRMELLRNAKTLSDIL
ncbi:hypothetical protein ACFLQ6_00120 [Thermoproteota archaeon]